MMYPFIHPPTVLSLYCTSWGLRSLLVTVSCTDTGATSEAVRARLSRDRSSMATIPPLHLTIVHMSVVVLFSIKCK